MEAEIFNEWIAVEVLIKTDLGLFAPGAHDCIKPGETIHDARSRIATHPHLRDHAGIPPKVDTLVLHELLGGTRKW